MEENDLLAFRRQKLEQLLERKVDPFGGRFDVSGSIGEVRKAFAEGEWVRAAGRITAHRNMGKSQFLDLSDVSGRLQVYINLKELPVEQAAIFQLVDIGDFLGVEGECFVTKTGEPTIRVEKFQILSKTLRPLPDKWHGITDIEIRNRQRYLDLIANPASREMFLTRSRIIREIRQYLDERGFLEVETPMMQPIAGGAAAQPFKTHHNALDMDLFLRIAPELYLKRLLVGGFTKVFELNRNFRNEGISRRHNPEFTMLEVYWAYADFEKVADLVEEMVCHLAEKLFDSRKMEGDAPSAPKSGARQRVPLQIEHYDADGNLVRTVNLKRPWRRTPYRDLIREVAGKDWFDLTNEQRRERATKQFKLEILPQHADFEVTQHVF